MNENSQYTSYFCQPLVIGFFNIFSVKHMVLPNFLSFHYLLGPSKQISEQK